MHTIRSSGEMSTLFASRLLVVLCTFSAFFGRLVTGTGVFQLKMGPFQNDLGRTTDGHCCSPIERDKSIRAGHHLTCSSPCRTFFVVCLRHYQTNIGDDSSSCTYGTTTTDVWNSSSSSEFHRDVDFGFDFTWPGAFTLVLEAYHDVTGRGPYPGSHRVLISRFKMQRFLDAAERWRHEDVVNEIGGDVIALSLLPRQQQQHRLHLAYRVTCDATFYGPGCDRLCVPRDDVFGHYDCDVTTGERVCRDGWNGTYCETAICSRGCEGVCDEPFECRCRTGWFGPLCDKCIVYPGCEHGSCNEPWQCNCHDGWGGLFCNQDLNYCATHRPCNNGGTCVHTGTPAVSTGVDDYRCYCQPGFTGTRCEQVELATVNDTDDCNQVGMGCLNGGICVQRYDTALAELVKLSPFWCRCLPDFAGTRCELTMNRTVVTNNNESSDAACSGTGCRAQAADETVSRRRQTGSSSTPSPVTHPASTVAATPPSHRRRQNDSRPSTSTRTPTLPAVDDVGDPGTDMRWIFLSVALGAGLALVTSSAVLVGVAWCRHLRQKRRAKRLVSTSIHENVRNDVTAAASGKTSRRFDVETKSTKMNNVVGASSKISIIDVGSKSVCCGDVGLGHALFGFASSDTNLLGECVEVKVANAGQACCVTRNNINSSINSSSSSNGEDKNRAKKTESAPANGGFDDNIHRQLRYAIVDDRCLRCRVADSVPESPLLILERIGLHPVPSHQRKTAENFEIPSGGGSKAVQDGGDEEDEQQRAGHRTLTLSARSRPNNSKQKPTTACETTYLV